VTRYGHQPLSEVMTMTESDFDAYFEALVDVVKREPVLRIG
jgi:hypothetical protein